MSVGHFCSFFRDRSSCLVTQLWGGEGSADPITCPGEQAVCDVLDFPPNTFCIASTSVGEALGEGGMRASSHEGAACSVLSKWTRMSVNLQMHFDSSGHTEKSAVSVVPQNGQYLKRAGNGQFEKTKRKMVGKVGQVTVHSFQVSFRGSPSTKVKPSAGHTCLQQLLAPLPQESTLVWAAWPPMDSDPFEGRPPCTFTLCLAEPPARLLELASHPLSCLLQAQRGCTGCLLPLAPRCPESSRE